MQILRAIRQHQPPMSLKYSRIHQLRFAANSGLLCCNRGLASDGGDLAAATAANPFAGNQVTKVFVDV
jgi:hypothetical protein